MSEKTKRRLNTNHPDCAEYTVKFHSIWDSYYALEDEEKAKYPNWRGLDHPANDVLCPAFRKCCAETKKLQEKYAYLFTEEE